MAENQDTREKKTFPRQETIKVESSRDERDPDKKIKKPVLYFENAPVWLVDRDQYGRLHVNDEMVVEILADKQEGHYLGKLIGPTKIMPEQGKNPEAQSERVLPSEETADLSLEAEVLGSAVMEVEFPEISSEAIPQILVFAREMVDQKEHEIVEAWAATTDGKDAIKESWLGYATVTYAMKREVYFKEEGKKALLEDDDYKRMAYAFHDLDKNRGKINLHTRNVIFNYLIQQQEAFRTELGVSTTPDERKNEIKGKMGNILTIEKALGKSMRGGEDMPDQGAEARAAIPASDLDADWSAFVAELNSDEEVSRELARIPSAFINNPSLIRAQLKALLALGHRIEIVTEKNPSKKWYNPKTYFAPRLPGSIRILDSGGNEVASVRTGAEFANFANGKLMEYQNQKREEFLQKRLPEKLQAKELEWLRDNVVDPTNIEEVFANAERMMLTQKLEDILRRAKREPGERDELRQYEKEGTAKGRDLQEDIGAFVKGGERRKLFEDFDGDDDQLRDLLTFGGYDPDRYFSAIEDSDREALRQAKASGLLNWLWTTWKIFSRIEAKIH